MKRRFTLRSDAWVLRTVFAALGSPLLLLWLIYLMAAPFYVFPSGTPQPADYLMVGLIALTTLTLGGRYLPLAVPAVRFHASFAIYAFLLTLVWTGLGVQRALIHPTFHFYNFLVFATALALYGRHRRRFLLVTAYGVALSVILQGALSRFVTVASDFYGGSARATVFFNNPNQLGYFALLSASLLVVGARYLGLSLLVTSLGFAASVYLALISLSKAAIFATLLLAVIFSAKRLSVLAAASVLLIVGFFTTDIAPSVVERASMRMSNIGQQEDDSLAGRGYDRIFNHPQYLLFGAGEGGYRRFRSEIPGEIHSTIGTVLFSYGLIGSGFLLAFLMSLVRGSPIQTWLFLVPLFLYGLTHNGLRFTLMWILFAFLFCSLLEERRARAQQQAAEALREPEEDHSAPEQRPPTRPWRPGRRRWRTFP